MLVDVEGIDPFGDGAAFATMGGRRIRIDAAIPGEQVEVRISDDGSGNLVGELVRIVRPSKHRVAPRCPYFGPCGGCTWQHIAYTEQSRLKEHLLQTLLRQAMGDAAPPVERMLTAEGGEWAFRNKVHFVLAPGSSGGGRLRQGGLVLGHYRRSSQAVVEVDQCPVHSDEGNRVAFAVRDALRRAGIEGATPDGRRGVARHIVVRVTRERASGVGRGAIQTMATLVVTQNDRRLRPAVRAVTGVAGAPDGLALNVNDRPGPYLFGARTRHLHGRRRVRETVAGVSFLISATAFFQTNVGAAEAMVRCVLEQAGTARTALDLYAGAGLFALPLATRGVHVVAVEENADAVEDGEASRRLNRIAESACTFVRGRAEDVAAGIRRRAIPVYPDIVVIDPPRAGCPPAVLDWICRSLHPQRVIYVSCNPQALARDLRTPLGAGYTLRFVQPVDMFPHTAHVETVAVFTR